MLKRKSHKLKDIVVSDILKKCYIKSKVPWFFAFQKLHKIENTGALARNTKAPRIRLQTRCADSKVYSPPVSPPTLSLLTVADGLDSSFPKLPLVPRCPLFPSTLPFSPFHSSACPPKENRSVARVDLSGAVAIKNSPVSGAWIADGTSTLHNFRSSRWQSLDARDSRKGTNEL